MSTAIPLAHLEVYTTYPGKPVASWTIDTPNDLRHVADWYHQQHDPLLETPTFTQVEVTFQDDSQLAFPAAALPTFVTCSTEEQAQWVFQIESEYDEGWETKLTSDDFSKVIEAFKKRPRQSRVIARHREDQPIAMGPFLFEDTDEDVVLPYDQKIDFEVKRPATRSPEEGEDLTDIVSVLRESFANINAVLESQRHFITQLREEDEELRQLRKRQRRTVHPEEESEWLRTLDNGEEHASVVGFGDDLLAREGAQWRQQFDVDGRTVRTGSPVQRMNKGNHSKEEILMHIVRRRGNGAPHDTLLPRSGFWIRFRPPHLEDHVTLQYQLSQLKINLGNITKGLAFSNLSQTLKSTVLDFCLQFVTHATCTYRTPTDLKEKIDLGDLDLVFWGLACTMYPRGFPYSHPCVADPSKCQHVVKEILNLHNLIWMDESSFTKKQREFLAKRPWDRPHTDDELEDFRNDHARGRKRIVWFEGDIGLEFKIPTAYEYEQAGQAWISGLVEMTNSAYNEPATGSSRMKYIDTLAMATTGRQYAHMVSGVYERSEDGSEEVLLGDDRDLIETIMASNFTTDEDFDKLFEAVKELIDDAVIGVIAVPSYDCPECDTPVATKFHKRFPHLVALDMLSTFFTLHSRKLRS